MNKAWKVTTKASEFSGNLPFFFFSISNEKLVEK